MVTVAMTSMVMLMMMASTVATTVAVHQAVDSVPAIGGQIHQTAILLDEILAFLS